MTALSRVRVGWSGFPGGPGVSTFYCLDPATFLPELHSFFFAVRGSIPTTITIKIEDQGDVIESTDGRLTGTWLAETTSAIDCAGDGVYAAPVGACVTWNTDTVANGHRLRGRTFLVPLVGAAFQLDGTINETNLPVFEAAALQLVTATQANFLVWSRPVLAVVGPNPRDPVTGSFGLVTGSSVPDKAIVLRSRRD